MPDLGTEGVVGLGAAGAAALVGAASPTKGPMQELERKKRINT